jgi:hypothetical protein
VSGCDRKVWIMRGPSPVGLVRHERINHILYCVKYQPGSCAHSQGSGHRDWRMRLDCRQWPSIMSSTPGVHKYRTSKLCTVATKFCVSTVWCLFQVTILAPGTLWWFQNFFLRGEFVFSCFAQCPHRLWGLLHFLLDGYRK